MKNKDLYKEFVNSLSHSPVFAENWYLDVVSNGNWEVVLSFDKQGNVQGALPFITKKKFQFLTVLSNPLFCPFLGPLVSENPQIISNFKKTNHYINIVRDLIRQLPEASYVNLRTSPGDDHWLAFHKEGFQQTTKYSYCIAHDKPISEIKTDLKKTLRQSLTKNANELVVQKSGAISEFLDLLHTTYADNGIASMFDRNLMANIINTAIKLEKGTIYEIRNSNNQLMSAIFIISDAAKAYLLFTTTTKEGKAKEGVAFCIWQAIQECVKSGLDFDFEGSMLEGVEQFFRSFGGIPVPYHQLSKVNNPFLKIYFAFQR